MIMKFYHKSIVVIISILLITNFAFSQEEKKPDTRPVRSPWSCGLLIDNQTTVSPSAKSIQLTIHHRFGNFENGFSDLFGIYAPSNIRFGLNIGITKKLMFGIGSEKNNKMQELLWKYNIIQQTRSGNIPVSISYFGNIVMDARDESFFGGNYKFTHRLSYFNQIIVGRKFSKKLSLQLAPGYSHFNSVDSVFQHDKIVLSLGGRYKFYNNLSFLFEYDQAFAAKKAEDYQTEIKPNLALGLEIGTSTHAFQITLSQFNNIISQKNFGYNLNDFTKAEGWLLGFNITVKF